MNKRSWIRASGRGNVDEAVMKEFVVDSHPSHWYGTIQV